MRKIIILLLCCGVILCSACNKAEPPPMESPPTTVSETIKTETPTETTPLITAVKPTEKEKEPVPTVSKTQATEPTTAAPTTTTELTEETKPTETAKPPVTTTKEETVTSQITVPSTTPQLTESESMVTEPPKEEPKSEPIQETAPEPEITQPEFGIQYWITFAREYAVSVGLKLDSEAVNCWDNPIGANDRCLYLERDLKSRLNRYFRDEEITDVWIWAESVGNGKYEIYIGYA